MKKTTKVLMTTIGILATIFVSAATVSCKNNEDDKVSVYYKPVNDIKTISYADILAQFSGKNSYGILDTVTFYSDGRYKEDLSGIYQSYQLNYTGNFGTYSGDPSTDGKITISMIKYYAVTDTGSVEDKSSSLNLPVSATFTISDSKLYITNRDGSTTTMKRTK